jgi:hypothetical protein
MAIQQDSSPLSVKELDRILKLKGGSKQLRHTVRTLRASSTFTVSFKHHVDQNGLEHIIRTTGVDGKEASSSTRKYDWQLREGQKTAGLGLTFVKYRRTKLEDVEDPYLREGWLPETIQDGLLESYEESRVPVAWSVRSVSLGF